MRQETVVGGFPFWGNLFHGPNGRHLGQSFYRIQNSLEEFLSELFATFLTIPQKDILIDFKRFFAPDYLTNPHLANSFKASSWET